LKYRTSAVATVATKSTVVVTTNRLVTFFSPIHTPHGACDAADHPLNFGGDVFQLRSRKAKSGGVANGASAINQDDESVLAVEQIIELLVKTLNVLLQQLTQRHSQRSAAALGGVSVAEANLTPERPCNRRNDKRLALAPNTKTASRHRVRASA
jgi:hypothetical protein